MAIPLTTCRSATTRPSSHPIAPSAHAVAPHDVSFVGARYPNRERTLSAVQRHADLAIWGGDWKRRPWRTRYYQRRNALDRAAQGPADLRTSAAIYAACAVNLNIHGPWDGLNMRVFEIPGAGGFQLCDERAGPGRLLPDVGVRS